jgi:hypothetical protein
MLLILLLLQCDYFVLVYPLSILLLFLYVTVEISIVLLYRVIHLVNMELFWQVTLVIHFATRRLRLKFALVPIFFT